MTKKMLAGCLILFLLLISVSSAQETGNYLLTREESSALYQKLLKTLWEKDYKIFYSPETHAWHGGPSSAAPTPEQVKDLWPNPVGYGSIIADDALYEGTLLVALLELYELTGDADLEPMINDTWLGLRMIGSAHGVRGFVPRGICPADGKSIYITSSRDQVTHYVDGLWQYYRSKFASDRSKKEIRKLLADLADVMREQVTPENDFSFLRADGSKDPRGLHKMMHVYSHEAARLPMIYAAALDTAGDSKYSDYYRDCAVEMIRQSRELKTRPMREVNSWVPTYSFYQMQCSLALMYRLEKDPKIKNEILTAMKEASEFSIRRIPQVVDRYGKREISELIMSWTMVRELELGDDQKNALKKTFSAWLDKNHKSGGPAETIHVLGAYSKACLNGYIPKPDQKTGLPLLKPVVNSFDLTELPATEKRTAFVRNMSETKPLIGGESIAVDPDLIVFLADVHVGPNPPDPIRSKNNNDRFKEACRMILELRPRPAAVVLAGDLSVGQGAKEDYLWAKPYLDPFRAAGIPLLFLFGNHDNRENFYSVFPEYRSSVPLVQDRLVQKLSLNRADFILLDTGAFGESQTLDRKQHQWLIGELNQCEKSGRPFFIVSHRSPEDFVPGHVHQSKQTSGSKQKSDSAQLGELTLTKQKFPHLNAWIHAHNHSFRDNLKSDLPTLGLQSTAYTADGSSHNGFSYMKLDKWEFVLRPITFNPDDVWARRPIVFRQ